MNKSEFAALDRRIRSRAERMWQEAGSPEGDLDSYLDEARELVALGEVALPTLDPYPTVEIVEEASLQRNLGEFPTLTDQGDEQTFPDEDRNIHLSDDDASEQGGVLPTEDLPAQDLPDIPTSAADITSDWPENDADLLEDDEEDGDLNDDGLPDLPSTGRAGE